MLLSPPQVGAPTPRHSILDNPLKQEILQIVFDQTMISPLSLEPVKQNLKTRMIIIGTVFGLYTLTLPLSC